jgi:hypothetical protein
MVLGVATLNKYHCPWMQNHYIGYFNNIIVVDLFAISRKNLRLTIYSTTAYRCAEAAVSATSYSAYLVSSPPCLPSGFSPHWSVLVKGRPVLVQNRPVLVKGRPVASSNLSPLTSI